MNPSCDPVHPTTLTKWQHNLSFATYLEVQASDFPLPGLSAHLAGPVSHIMCLGLQMRIASCLSHSAISNWPLTLDLPPFPVQPARVCCFAASKSAPRIKGIFLSLVVFVLRVWPQTAIMVISRSASYLSTGSSGNTVAAIVCKISLHSILYFSSGVLFCSTAYLL